MINILSRFINDRLYNNAFFLVATNFFVIGMGFLFWVICARWYSPDDVGLPSTTISAMMFITSISSLG
jgi:O-antigen/teichoic acid export membrane protein